MDNRVTGDSLTPLAAWAGQMHEMYEAFRQAGFSDDQAINLLSGLLKQAGP